jgi:cysteine desulfuration protein SufE
MIENTVLKEYSELFDSMPMRDVYDYLMQIGESGGYPIELQTSENFVNGCQSQVWIYGFINDSGKLQFIGDSDSFMVRGTVYLITAIANEMDIEQMQNISWQDIEPLARKFTAQRKRGMQSMLNKIRSVAKSYS